MKNYKILAELRKKKKLKEKEVACMLHLDHYSISCYERGKAEPSIDTIVKLADIYNVSIENIVIPNDDSVLLTKKEYDDLKAYKTAFILQMQCFKNVKNDYFTE